MSSYLVFGLGMMGEAICHDILQNDPEAEIIAVEMSRERIDLVKRRFDSSSISYHQLTLGVDDDEIMKLLNLSSLAFGAIDYKFNEKITQMCIDSFTHFIDLGGNPNIVENQHKLHEKALEAKITVIPDCGVAPGMVNIISADLIRQFEQADECHIRVGGLPLNPKTILNYQQVFSIRGLTNEYLEDALVIRNRKIQKVPALSEVEILKFPEPFGELEAFQTSGGTSSLPLLFQNKINHLTYKTLRYPGHVKYFQFLREFGLLTDKGLSYDCNTSPREIIENHLVEYLPKFQPDAVLIRIFCCGVKDGSYQKIQYQCIDTYDSSTQLSAMARTTAFPISIIGQMITQGLITDRGVLTGEVAIPTDHFLRELESRRIIFETSIE